MNKTRNKIAVAATAVALALFGASTFAAWSEEGVLPLEAADISTGHWTFALSDETSWYDISPELDDSSGEIVPVPITLSEFPLVPGDVIQGVIKVTADLTNLVGEHLDAEVGKVTVADGPVSPVAWLTASAAVTGGDEVTVTIEFPLDNTNDYDTQSNLDDVSVALGKLGVTVTQVR